MYRSASSSVFMTNKTPSGEKEKHLKISDPKSLKLPKLVPFFIQAKDISKLHGSHSGLCTEQPCTSTLLLHNFKVSQGAWNHPLKNYGSIRYAISFNCVHALEALIVLSHFLETGNATYAHTLLNLCQASSGLCKTPCIFHCTLMNMVNSLTKYLHLLINFGE